MQPLTETSDTTKKSHLRRPQATVLSGTLTVRSSLGGVLLPDSNFNNVRAI